MNDLSSLRYIRIFILKNKLVTHVMGATSVSFFITAIAEFVVLILKIIVTS